MSLDEHKKKKKKLQDLKTETEQHYHTRIINTRSIIQQDTRQATNVLQED